MRTSGHLVVVGSGAFARSVATSLAARPGAPHVTVLARDLGAATALALACTARAGTHGTAVTFAAERLAPDDAALAAQLSALAPDVLVCCASDQSPYERIARPSAWTDLVARAGFGLTLPLQAVLAARLARALTAAHPEAVLVNAAFPDAVDPLLARLDLPVLCGVGNVSTLAACLRAATGADEPAVVGHHAQLAETDLEVRAWADGRELSGVTDLLRPYRELPRRELNAIGGHAAARLLVALVDGSELRTSVPGPQGLPGGYPVRIADRRLELRLPPGMDRAAAVRRNVRAGAPDGVEVSDGRVHHAPRLAAALEEHLPEVAAGWPVGDLDETARRLDSLRLRLRTAPTTGTLSEVAPTANTDKGPECSQPGTGPTRSRAT